MRGWAVLTTVAALLLLPPQSAAAQSEDLTRYLDRPDEPTRRTTPLPRPQGEPIGN